MESAHIMKYYETKPGKLGICSQNWRETMKILWG
jgi:hypothetical protein